MKPDANKMNFKKLVDAIRKIHDQLSDQACRAVNTSLTLRNWLIGLYIQEYEQHGADRAQYGESLNVLGAYQGQLVGSGTEAPDS